MRLGARFCVVGFFSFFLTTFVFADAAQTPLVDAGPLKVISKSPAPIANAAKAVVHIELIDGSGTGFFISNDGLLLTNHHVVGPTECPLNGCFLTLRQNWNGSDAATVASYFATPYFTVPELDTAVLQVWAAPPAERHSEPTQKLPTPHFLVPASDTLTGEPITVVGHAFGGIQRFSTGTLRLVRGDWRAGEILVVPGMSGSPVVNADGKVVGIAHRSLTDGESVLDLANLRHVGIFTAWSAFDRIWKNRDSGNLKKPLEGYISLPTAPMVDPEELAELTESISDFDVLFKLFAARRQRRFVVDTTKIEEDLQGALLEEEQEGAKPMQEGEEQKPRKKKGRKNKGNGKKEAAFDVRTMLPQLCKGEVSSDEAIQEPDYDYPFCQSALSWFDCREDGSSPAEPPIYGLAADSAEKWEYKYCPNAKEQEAFKKLFTQVEELLELKNQAPLQWLVVSAGVFETTEKAANEAVKKAVQTYFDSHPDLAVLEKTFAVAAYAGSLDEAVTSNKSLAQVLADYPTLPDRTLFLEEMIATLEFLNESKVLSREQLSEQATRFFAQADVPTVLKIDLEAVLADARKLPVTDSKRNRRNRSSAKAGSLKIRMNNGASPN